MANNSSNNPASASPNAKQFLNSMKYEMASELGLSNYAQVDKGSLSSRQNGYVGGYMVRKMIQFAEDNMK